MSPETLLTGESEFAPPAFRVDLAPNSSGSMVELQATRFWNTALQSGLVDGPQLEGCWGRIPLDKRTPDAADRRLARKAVEMGYLTLWQAQQLLGGVRPQLMRYDKYTLLDMIGQGGMGRVYLAKDVRLG